MTKKCVNKMKVCPKSIILAAKKRVNEALGVYLAFIDGVSALSDKSMTFIFSYIQDDFDSIFIYLFICFSCLRLLNNKTSRTLSY